MNNKPVIAVFDFDDTITTCDTLFDFIRFYKGKVRFWAGLAIVSPILVAFKLGFISNQSAKQRLLTFFFENTKESDFDAVCVKYKQRIDEIVKPEAIDRIKWHQQQGHNVIINSASISKWIIPWAAQMQISEVIATEMEVIDGLITGRFWTPNCHKQEKVNRLLALYPDRDSYKLYAYGDSSGDNELLALADNAFYRKFSQ